MAEEIKKEEPITTLISMANRLRTINKVAIGGTSSLITTHIMEATTTIAMRKTPLQQIG